MPAPRRNSAVLVPLYEEHGEIHVVLTRRPWHMRSHRGEVSFPGGGQDPGETLWETALREAHEETALDPELVSHIGHLDRLRTFSSNNEVVPFVGALPHRPRLSANPAEVDAILHVRLAELVHPDAYREERWPIFDNEAPRPIWFFEIEGDTIWGATANLLRQLICTIWELDHR